MSDIVASYADDVRWESPKMLEVYFPTPEAASTIFPAVFAVSSIAFALSGSRRRKISFDTACRVHSDAHTRRELCRIGDRKTSQRRQRLSL
jgi:hypothetical protein